MTEPADSTDRPRLRLVARRLSELPGYEDDGPLLPRPQTDGALALATVPPTTTRPELEVVPEPRVEFGPERTPPGALPPPGPRALVLVRAVVEALAGDRPLTQLAPWTTQQVIDQLSPRVRPSSARPWAGTVRRVAVCEPAPGVAEVAAVVQRGPRAGALALRLEGLDGRWQLTAIQLD